MVDTSHDRKAGQNAAKDEVSQFTGRIERAVPIEKLTSLFLCQ
jgi:hypothetical protein